MNIQSITSKVNFLNFKQNNTKKHWSNNPNDDLTLRIELVAKPLVDNDIYVSSDELSKYTGISTPAVETLAAKDRFLRQLFLKNQRSPKETEEIRRLRQEELQKRRIQALVDDFKKTDKTITTEYISQITGLAPRIVKERYPSSIDKETTPEEAGAVFQPSDSQYDAQIIKLQLILKPIIESNINISKAELARYSGLDLLLVNRLILSDRSLHEMFNSQFDYGDISNKQEDVQKRIKQHRILQREQIEHLVEYFTDENNRITPTYELLSSCSGLAPEIIEEIYPLD